MLFCMLSGPIIRVSNRTRMIPFGVEFRRLRAASFLGRGLSWTSTERILQIHWCLLLRSTWLCEKMRNQWVEYYRYLYYSKKNRMSEVPNFRICLGSNRRENALLGFAASLYDTSLAVFPKRHGHIMDLKTWSPKDHLEMGETQAPSKQAR